MIKFYIFASFLLLALIIYQVFNSKMNRRTKNIEVLPVRKKIDHLKMDGNVDIYFDGESNPCAVGVISGWSNDDEYLRLALTMTWENQQRITKGQKPKSNRCVFLFLKKEKYWVLVDDVFSVDIKTMLEEAHDSKIRFQVESVE